MRSALSKLGANGPDRLDLAYTSWAPTDESGGVPVGKRGQWLKNLAEIVISKDYAVAFERWKRSVMETGTCVEIETTSRLLFGHGNDSATDVGLGLQHTWGVPFIPGSALKGLAAHYVDAVYGRDGDAPSPFAADPPGDAYRALFGAPEIAGAEGGGGKIVFHDALYVPNSAPRDRPFAVDVLTVHQVNYYKTPGASWPNDKDEPKPVQFISVRPGIRMLLAIDGPPTGVDFAMRLLKEALAKWGVGGKISSGYGRFSEPSTRKHAISVPSRAYKPGDPVMVMRTDRPDPKGKNRVVGVSEDGIGGFIPEGAVIPAEGEFVELEIDHQNNDGSYSFRLPRLPKKKTQSERGKR